MKTTHRACDVSKNVGIYVEFALAEDGKNRYKLEIISSHRVKLLISLPPSNKDRKVKLETRRGSPIVVRAWTATTLQIIKKVETGAFWPLRFEYDNLIQFLSMEELAWVEKQMHNATAYVYGAPKPEEKNCFDDDTLRRWVNAAARETFSQMKAKGAAPLEGQMSLLDLVT